MKKFLLGIATFITIAVLCVVSADAESYGDYEYTVLDDGTVEITSYTGSATKLEIPSVIEGKKVTNIGMDAFRSKKLLKSIVIPDSITSIGDYAFYYCSSLTSVTIPDGVKSIGNDAFASCSSLEFIDVDSDNRYYISVDGVLFNKNKTALIIYPAKKTGSSYTILSSVTSIDDYAFENCDNLTSITIPDTVTDIGNGAFYECSSLTSIAIPEKVLSISDFSFYRCSSLKTVDIPNNITNIGAYAFYECSSLESITIPDSVTSIGDCAFRGCLSLTSIITPDIGIYAFASCTSLTSVTILDGATDIPWGAFSGCSSLTSVTISDSVENIGTDAFLGCISLKSINIPDSVTLINGSAFNRCLSLTSISIPDSVTTIENYAFAYCASLSSITILDKVTYICDFVFEGCSDNLTINCYNGSTAHQYAIDNGFKYKLLDSVAAPSAVTGFKSPSKSTTAIRLNWTANDAAEGYIIEQYTNSGWMQIADITDPETVTYKVTDLTPGTAYKFRMRAYNAGGESKNTATLTVNTQMTAVKGFTSPSKSTTAIRLNWTKNAYADGYIIDQYTNSGWVQIADITDPATVTYKVTELKSGTAYKFRMKAYSVTKYGETIYGDKTATLTVNTQASAVTGLALKSRSSTALRLKWTKNTAVDGYIIEQYIDGKWVQIADIDNYATTEYKVTGLSASTKYKFRMKAYAITKYGDKTYSPYTSVLSKTTNPSTISGLKVKSKAQTAIRLAWSKNTSATGYCIEQYIDGKWVQVAKIEDNATLNYRIDGLTKATTYKFRVRAYNVVGTTTLYSDYKTVSGTTNS